MVRTGFFLEPGGGGGGCFKRPILATDLKLTNHLEERMLDQA